MEINSTAAKGGQPLDPGCEPPTPTGSVGPELEPASTSPTAPSLTLAEEGIENLEFDPEEVVDAAEALLREAAPHDFDILILGAGPGGYAAALRAAQLGCHVGLVEERQVGGVCISTKSLLETIGVLRLIRRAQEYGIELTGTVTPNLALMHARKFEIVRYLRANIERVLAEAGVEIIRGRARFSGEHSVLVSSDDGERSFTAVHVIIATGGRPARIPVPGAELPGVLTSDEILDMAEVPAHLAVVGAGAVGVEFAYLFRELGARSTLLEAYKHVLPQEDEDVQEEMERSLHAVGVEVIRGARLQHIEAAEHGLRLVYRRGESIEHIEADKVLLAVGRLSNIEDMGLRGAGIETDAGKITVDENLQTSVAGVYAVGDCIRRVGWAHRAAVEGRLVVERIMGYVSDADLRFTPACYYTHPEVASTGLTLANALALGINAKAGTFFFRENGRAAAAGEHDGFVKLVFELETERLLGCQIIGPRATDIINEAVIALRSGWTLEHLIDTIHAHPTFAEALPSAALAARRHLREGDAEGDGMGPKGVPAR